MGEIAATREQAKRLSKEWTDESKRDQEFIRKKMNQIKAIVSEKEKELFRSCDGNLERNCDILKGEATNSEKSLEVISGVKRNIEQTLKKEDLTILQEFNKRDEEASEGIQLAERERDRMREHQLKSPLRCIDTTLLDEQLDRIIGDLQGIKLTSTIPKV